MCAEIRASQSGDRLEQLEALGLLVADHRPSSRRAAPVVGRAPARQEPGQPFREAAEQLAGATGIGHERGQGLRERLERCPRVGVAASVEDPGVLRMDVAGEVPGQGRLAHPSAAPQQHQAVPAVGHGAPRPLQLGQLRLPPHEQLVGGPRQRGG